MDKGVLNLIELHQRTQDFIRDTREVLREMYFVDVLLHWQNEVNKEPQDERLVYLLLDRYMFNKREELKKNFKVKDFVLLFNNYIKNSINNKNTMPKETNEEVKEFYTKFHRWFQELTFSWMRQAPQNGGVGNYTRCEAMTLEVTQELLKKIKYRDYGVYLIIKTAMLSDISVPNVLKTKLFQLNDTSKSISFYSPVKMYEQKVFTTAFFDELRNYIVATMSERNGGNYLFAKTKGSCVSFLYLAKEINAVTEMLCLSKITPDTFLSLGKSLTARGHSFEEIFKD